MLVLKWEGLKYHPSTTTNVPQGSGGNFAAVAGMCGHWWGTSLNCVKHPTYILSYKCNLNRFVLVDGKYLTF